MADIARNKALVTEYFTAFANYDEAWWQAHIAPDFVRHDPGLDFEVVGPAGIKRLADHLHGALSDIDMAVDDLVAEGDQVLARLRQQGRHTGEIFGVAATNTRVEFDVMDLFRFDGDRLVEHWALLDNLAFRKQIGATEL